MDERRARERAGEGERGSAPCGGVGSGEECPGTVEKPEGIGDGEMRTE